jgi:hypothetical protein
LNRTLTSISTYKNIFGEQKKSRSERLEGRKLLLNQNGAIGLLGIKPPFALEGHSF